MSELSGKKIKYKLAALQAEHEELRKEIITIASSDTLFFVNNCMYLHFPELNCVYNRQDGYVYVDTGYSLSSSKKSPRTILWEYSEMPGFNGKVKFEILQTNEWERIFQNEVQYIKELKKEKVDLSKIFSLSKFLGIKSVSDSLGAFQKTTNYKIDKIILFYDIRALCSLQELLGVRPYRSLEACEYLHALDTAGFTFNDQKLQQVSQKYARLKAIQEVIDAANVITDATKGAGSMSTTPRKALQKQMPKQLTSTEDDVLLSYDAAQVSITETMQTLRIAYLEYESNLQRMHKVFKNEIKTLNLTAYSPANRERIQSYLEVQLSVFLSSPESMIKKLKQMRQNIANGKLQYNESVFALNPERANYRNAPTGELLDEMLSVSMYNASKHQNFLEFLVDNEDSIMEICKLQRSLISLSGDYIVNQKDVFQALAKKCKTDVVVSEQLWRCLSKIHEDISISFCELFSMALMEDYPIENLSSVAQEAEDTLKNLQQSIQELLKQNLTVNNYLPALHSLLYQSATALRLSLLNN